jgi:hypothetical protein
VNGEGGEFGPYRDLSALLIMGMGWVSLMHLCGNPFIDSAFGQLGLRVLGGREDMSAKNTFPRVPKREF